MRNLENLGSETRDILEHYGYTPDDIAFIAFNNQYKTNDIVKFFDIADAINYDAGYGSEKINTNLRIYMKDNNYFIRKSYDGSEWWDIIFSEVPDLKELNDFDDSILRETYNY